MEICNRHLILHYREQEWYALYYLKCSFLDSSLHFHKQTSSLAPKKHDRPTLPLLLKFPSNAGNVNVMEQIGTNYKMLGTLLLNDDTGELSAAIIKQCQMNALDINYHILQKWIQGRGSQPVTWDTLVEVLRSISLSELANAIESALL